MSQRPPYRQWQFPLSIIQNKLWFLLWVWGAFTIVILAIVSAIGWTGVLNWAVVEDAGGGSGIEGASGIIPWFFLFYLGFHMHQILPVYIANGRTRRNALIEGGIFVGAITAAAAALMCVSFLIENVVYRIGGWTHGVSGERLFSSPLQLHFIFVDYFLTFLVWSLVGGFLGIGFYRSDAWGWALIIPAIIPVAVAGIALRAIRGAIEGPFLEIAEALDLGAPTLPSALLWSLIATALVVLMAWPVIRNIPVRSKGS